MFPPRANDKLRLGVTSVFFFFLLKNLCPINISLSIKKDLSGECLKRFVRKLWVDLLLLILQKIHENSIRIPFKSLLNLFLLSSFWSLSPF